MTHHNPSSQKICELVETNKTVIQQDIQRALQIDTERIFKRFQIEVVPRLDYYTYAYGENDTVRLIALRLLYNDYTQCQLHDSKIADTNKGVKEAVMEVSIDQVSKETLIGHLDNNWTRFLGQGWNVYLSEDNARNSYTSKLVKGKIFDAFLHYYGTCWRKYKIVNAISSAWALKFRFGNWDELARAQKRSKEIKELQKLGGCQNYNFKRLFKYNNLFDGSSALEVTLAQHCCSSNEKSPRFLQNESEAVLNGIFDNWPISLPSSNGKATDTRWWSHYLQLLRHTKPGSIGSLCYKLAAVANYRSRFDLVEYNLRSHFEARLLEGSLDEQLLWIGENYTNSFKRVNLKTYITKGSTEFMWGEFKTPSSPEKVWLDCLYGSCARLLETYLIRDEEALSAIASIKQIKSEYNRSGVKTNYFLWLTEELNISLPQATAFALIHMNAESLRRTLDKTLVRKKMIPLFVKIAVEQFGSNELKNSTLCKIYHTFNGGEKSIIDVATLHGECPDLVQRKLYSLSSVAQVLDTIFELNHDNEQTISSV